MYKVKILNNINSEELKKLDSAQYAISEDVENPDVILVRSAQMHEMEFGPELLCIGRAGAGVNNIPIDRCADDGIIVFNTPGANAEAVKELALCAMFLSSRDILGGVTWVRSIASGGDEIVALIEKQKSDFSGPEIRGKTLGVIGLGSIGAIIAQAAHGLGMIVYGYDPYLSVEAAWGLSPDIIRADDVNALYRMSDFITLHVPYLKSTHNMINKKSIAKMKPGIRVINLARAELVNDDDMLEALASGQVKHYVTDFPNEKTAGAPGVIPIPHLGASTPESEDNCVSMVCAEIIDYVENGNITNSVNMTHAYMPRTDDPRICIIHYNVPDMIAKITAEVSKLGVNIENMLNSGTKGRSMAYTMLDIDTIPDGLEAAIGKIKGVIRVRALP